MFTELLDLNVYVYCAYNVRKMKKLGTLRCFASLFKDEASPSVITDMTPTIKVTTEQSSAKERGDWKVRGTKWKIHGSTVQ